MCLILTAINPNPEYKLVLASNRDEFYERPTKNMFWRSNEDILSGEDELKKGMWLGLNKNGRLAAVTNVRDFSDDEALSEPEKKESRGDLVKNFLEGQARVVYALEVCESDIHIPVFKRIMDVSYVSAGAYDEGDKMIVDMLWPALWSLDDPDKNGITTSQMVKNLKQLKVADFDEWTSTCKSFEETIAETYLK